MDHTIVRRWAIASAACVALAAIWFALYQNYVIVPPIPDQGSGVAEDVAVAAWYAWLRDHGWQYQGFILVLTAGFLAIAGLGRALSTLPDADGGGTEPAGIDWGSAGRMLTVAGVIGATAGFLHVGARQAVAIASEAPGRQATTSIIHFVTDRSFEAALGGSFLLLGIGIVASAVVARRMSSLGTAWPALGAVTGVIIASVGLQYLIQDPLGLRDVLLLLGGVVLFPAWAVLLAVRLGSTASGSTRAMAAAGS